MLQLEAPELHAGGLNHNGCSAQIAWGGRDLQDVDWCCLAEVVAQMRWGGLQAELWSGGDYIWGEIGNLESDKKSG